jgi:hypothetical protein
MVTLSKQRQFFALTYLFSLKDLSINQQLSDDNFMNRLPAPRVRCPEVTRALEGIKYIAAVTRAEEESNKV